MDFIEQLQAIANENLIAEAQANAKPLEPPEPSIPLHKKLERMYPRNPSAVADETGQPMQRAPGQMLRPIYINGVEVGYCYGEACGKKGTLSIKGCVVTLWYFLMRGHDAKVFFPQCYRRYMDKTDDYDLLVGLDRIGLVQFTQGVGQEKYNELSRVLAANARRFGGCIVACSSLRRVFEENQVYHRIVQKRVLVPCFVGNEVLFPADGPEGRTGAKFGRTVIASPEDGDFEAARGMQMKLEYQVRILNALREIHPNGRNLAPITEKFNAYLKGIQRSGKGFRQPNSDPVFEFGNRPRPSSGSGVDGFRRPIICQTQSSYEPPKATPGYQGHFSTYEAPTAPPEYQGSFADYEPRRATPGYQGNASGYEPPRPKSRYQDNASCYEPPRPTPGYQGNASSYEPPRPSSGYHGHFSSYEATPGYQSNSLSYQPPTAPPYQGGHSGYEPPRPTSGYQGGVSGYEPPRSTSRCQASFSSYEPPRATQGYQGNSSSYQPPKAPPGYQGSHSGYEPPRPTPGYQGGVSGYEPPKSASGYQEFAPPVGSRQSRPYSMTVKIQAPVRKANGSAFSPVGYTPITPTYTPLDPGLTVRVFSDTVVSRKPELVQPCRKEVVREPFNFPRNGPPAFPENDEDYVSYSYIGGKRQERTKLF